MRIRKWLVVCVVVIGVPGLLVTGTQAARASTLGTTTMGALDGGGLVANSKRVNEYQLNVLAVVSKLDIYLSPSRTAGSQAMEGVIYADGGGSPGALVAQSQEISFSSTSRAGWVDLPLAGNVTLSPGRYWLGIYTGATDAVASYRYDLGATNRARLADKQTYVTGGASDPFGAIASGDQNVMSLYATYTTPPTWTNQPVPAPARASGLLSGVSCASRGTCIGVGSDLNASGTRVALAERRHGSSWSIQTIPDPVGATSSSLTGVSCTSSTACTAVGSYTSASGRETLAERWNGSRWSIQATPNPGAADNRLNAVSCTSSTACTAVGSSSESSGSGVTLAERWNGASWSIQATPNPPSEDNNEPSSSFSGVSCTSRTACTAVGLSYPSLGTVTLAERWNGTSWSIQTTPDLRADDTALAAVSCTSRVACTATGYSADEFGPGLTLAERWNGTSWSIQTTPNPQTDSNTLTGVSCTSSTVCTAVGTSNAGSNRVTLAERWNGAVWSIQATPNPTGETNSSLNGVSCTSNTACTAVGSAASSYQNDVTLAERWNSSRWSIQATQNPTGATSSSFGSVSCTSSTACTAVGGDGQNGRILAEHWDGASWSVQATPTMAGAFSISASGVSCTSSTACTAVGSYDNASGTFALAERWSGSSWSIQSAPNPSGASYSRLNAVSCTSSTACTAVGDAGGMTLVETWNGSSWSIQATASPLGASSSSLSGVSCTTSTACTAVGSSSDTVGDPVTLAERWNGTSWSIQPTLNPASYSGFSGVSCTSSTACTAVGEDFDNGRTLAEHWDGTSWSIQTTQNLAGNGVLSAVSCQSSSECTAVGSSAGSAPGVTLAEQWNGTSWSIQTTPNPGVNFSRLGGVSCTSSIACTAVGSFGRGLALPLAQRLG